MKERIAFVVTGYGKDVNGGTEQHCRMLAERLVNDYEVEVLTTCVKDYVKGENVLPAGEEWINKVLVRRFEARPVSPELHNYYVRKSRWIRRLRKFFYQLRILRFLSCLHPIWTYMKELEEKVMQSYVFYSPKLISYVQEHQDDYKAIIPINISYPLAYYVSLCVPEKTILIPTMHYESSIFRAIYTNVFTNVFYIGFNTVAEQKLSEKIFSRRRMASHGIISVGIDNVVDADWETTKRKFNLPDEYLLYVGRIDSGKLHHIIQYYLSYRKKYSSSNLKFVLVGRLFTQPVQHPDIIYTGFVDDDEKYTIIQHAKILVNPSKFESLSLILLEGISRGKAMLVNGKCAVLREHCLKSGNAVLYYTGRANFISTLYRIDTSDKLRLEMAERGMEYVRKNYNWDTIIKRLKQVIESL